MCGLGNNRFTNPFGDRGFKSGHTGTDGLGFWPGFDIQAFMLRDMNVVAVRLVHNSYSDIYVASQPFAPEQAELCKVSYRATHWVPTVKINPLDLGKAQK